MSGGGFNNPVVNFGGDLVRQAIRSPNYVPGVSGWTINKDGSVEFQNGVFRGDITASDILGSNFYTAAAAPRIEMGSSIDYAGLYYSIRFNQSSQGDNEAQIYTRNTSPNRVTVIQGAGSSTSPKNASIQMWDGDSLSGDAGDLYLIHFSTTNKEVTQLYLTDEGLMLNAPRRAYMIVDSGNKLSSAGVSPITTANTAVPGTSQLITVYKDDCRVKITGIYDMTMLASDANIGVGAVTVNGVEQPRTAIYRGLTINNRMTVAFTWIVTLPTAGDYTIEMRVRATNNTSVGLLFGTMTYEVWE